MEDQAIGFHGQAGEREKMMLYKKPLVGRILSSRLLLFAAVGLMLTPSTATEREGHDQRTPTPHPRPHPRPSQAAETPLPLPGGWSSTILLQETRSCRITLPGMAGRAPTHVWYGKAE